MKYVEPIINKSHVIAWETQIHLSLEEMVSCALIGKQESLKINELSVQFKKLQHECLLPSSLPWGDQKELIQLDLSPD